VKISISVKKLWLPTFGIKLVVERCTGRNHDEPALIPSDKIFFLSIISAEYVYCVINSCSDILRKSRYMKNGYHSCHRHPRAANVFRLYQVIMTWKPFFFR
jgi:hypothetical protein